YRIGKRDRVGIRRGLPLHAWRAPRPFSNRGRQIACLLAEQCGTGHTGGQDADGGQGSGSADAHRYACRDRCDSGTSCCVCRALVDVCCLPWAAGTGSHCVCRTRPLSLSSVVSLAEKPLLGSAVHFLAATVPVVAVRQTAPASETPAGTAARPARHLEHPRWQAAVAAVAA